MASGSMWTRHVWVPYPETRHWFFGIKPKRKDRTGELLREIGLAQDRLFGVQAVRVKPTHAAKIASEPRAICPECGEAYPCGPGPILSGMSGHDELLRKGGHSVTTQQVFSVCGMCTVRCPIMAEVRNGEIQFLQGNPHIPAMKGSICPRGAAGKALIQDYERLQTPLIREGQRGEGKWRKVGWDEALDEVANRLKSVIGEHGARSVAFSDRGGPFRDLHQAFVRGLGSPNYTNHDSSCARNVQHACMSVAGVGRKELLFDFKNARHVVLQTRNIFEAVNVQEVNNLTDALSNGCKLTVIDIRATISASKADRFMLVRPGSDYALNLAVIHELMMSRLYDAEYAARWIKDLGAAATSSCGRTRPSGPRRRPGLPPARSDSSCGSWLRPGPR